MGSSMGAVPGAPLTSTTNIPEKVLVVLRIDEYIGQAGPP